MATLLMKLAGPLQSWGSESRFSERKTRHEPTKSGVVGLLAAALGRRRTEDISDLAALTFAVRIDQPGRMERDFQSAHTRKFNRETERWDFDKAMPLSQRYYLSDAIFVVGLEGDNELLMRCASALDCPRFPLFLGRRSCPPSDRILLSYEADRSLMEMLRDWPWEASVRVQRRCKKAMVELELMRDSVVNDSDNLMRETLRDVPLSFSQAYRDYSWRTVVHDRVSIPNPLVQLEHNPMAVFEEAGEQ